MSKEKENGFPLSLGCAFRVTWSHSRPGQAHCYQPLDGLFCSFAIEKVLPMELAVLVWCDTNKPCACMRFPPHKLLGATSDFSLTVICHNITMGKWFAQAL